MFFTSVIYYLWIVIIHIKETEATVPSVLWGNPWVDWTASGETKQNKKVKAWTLYHKDSAEPINVLVNLKKSAQSLVFYKITVSLT